MQPGLTARRLQAVKDKLYVLGAGTVEGVLKLPTKVRSPERRVSHVERCEPAKLNSPMDFQEMKDAGIHKTEEQLLREKASQIVSTGSRGQRVRQWTPERLHACGSKPIVSITMVVAGAAKNGQRNAGAT